MSFYDEPIVDDNSKRSEESVHVVRGLFTRKNGFITREENPDYGVDLDVELMIADKGASSFKFPVQIKSTIGVQTIQAEDKPYISYPFRTSRLGYLAKRQPAYGIIALYDDTAQTCYFDYLDDIITRLDNHPAREDWRNQEQVNILLPVQILEPAILPEIHKRFLTRHQNSQLMLQEHGQKFNIPALDVKDLRTETKIDFTNPAQVADYLEKFGAWLYNEAAFAMLNHLLGVVSKERLNNSWQLVFLAAITYTQTGNIIDAEYYLRRARKMPEVMKGEGTGLIEFSAARVEFMKGNIDYDFFLKSFREVANNSETIANQLTLKINILFFELARGMETGVFPENYEQQVANLRGEIEAAAIPAMTKHLCLCHHADSQFHYALHGEMSLYSEVKLKDDLQNPMPMAKRARRALHLIGLIDAADKAVYNAYVYGRDQGHPLLKATGAHQMGQHFFARRSSLLLLREEDKMPQERQQLVELFERNQNYSIIAYGQFLELNMFQNAHEALVIAYEINQLCIHLTETSVGEKKPEELMSILREIEAKFELPPFESRMDVISAQLQSHKKHDGRYLKGQSDTEITETATKILNGYDLSADRLPNLVHDLKMHRKFEQEVTNPHLVMLQDMRHTQNPATHYAQPPLYIIRHLKLNVQTPPSSDINWLLKYFSTILKNNE